MRHRRKRPARRRGMALVIVLITLTTSIIISYSLLRSETIALQISQNVESAQKTKAAAREALERAIARMHSTSWLGVDHPIDTLVETTPAGTLSTRVEFVLPDTTTLSLPPETTGLCLRVRAIATFAPTGGTGATTTSECSAVLQLQPRVPALGTAVADTDDVRPNPGDADEIFEYSVFAFGSYKPLTTDPGDRIEGNIFVGGVPRIYRDPLWDTTVRAATLQALGNELATGGFQYPHPLSGTMTFPSTPTSSEMADLVALKTPWSVDTTPPQVPSIDPSSWQTYRLYEGGPAFQAKPVADFLSNVSLGPTADNPLGIFYNNDRILLTNNVIVRGTLVAPNGVTIAGYDSHLSPVNWRSSTGSPIRVNATAIPRLPAVVSSRFEMTRGSSATIDGNILATSFAGGAGADVLRELHDTVLVSGPATIAPDSPRTSRVQFENAVSFSAVPTNGAFELWVPEGASGSWHRVESVDIAGKAVVIRGLITQGSPTPCQLKGKRRHAIEIRGRMIAGRVDINRVPSWGSVPTETWTALYTAWSAEVAQLVALGLPPRSFLDFLADKSVHTGTLADTGLTTEPTFHLRPGEPSRSAWTPPLFRAATQGSTGYRWRILRWEEAP